MSVDCVTSLGRSSHPTTNLLRNLKHTLQQASSFPGKVPRNRFPKIPKGFQKQVPKQGSQRFPGRGSQARVPKKRFPSKVSKNRFPRQVSKQGFPSKAPRNRFASKVSKHRCASKVFVISVYLKQLSSIIPTNICWLVLVVVAVGDILSAYLFVARRKQWTTYPTPSYHWPRQIQINWSPTHHPFIKARASISSSSTSLRRR